MTTDLNQQQNVVYVEYCRACQTHNWCTHHDQAKYHDTFLKLSEIITQRYPHLEVIGNMIPSNLIPFKITENKYIDSNTNKYVVYPQIGSFEVIFNGTLVFSKKDTNGWPNLSSILSKISSIIDPNYQSPSKIENLSKSPKKSKQNTPSKMSKNNEFLKNSDELKTHYKDPAKGFTLTDHFKMYRPKYKMEDKDWLTEKQESDGSSKQISDFGRGDSREKSDKSDQFKSMLREFSGDSKLKEMLKNKGLMLKDHGKKEMIIKLDSIEEQNICYDDNGATQRTTQKNSKKKKMQELQDEFSSLENKFINFQSKVKDIKNKNQEFQFKEGEQLKKSKSPYENKKEDLEKSKVKQFPSFDKPLPLFADKPSKLELYLNASEQEKKEKLHRIYGEWKLLKQSAKKNRRLLKNKDKNEENDSDEETSQAHSNSPSTAQVLTFKPKPQSNIQQQIAAAINAKQTHKFSTIEKHENTLTSVMSQPKFRTDDNFYHKKYVSKPKKETEKDKESQVTTKINKNNNTMSSQALRSIANRQSQSKYMMSQKPYADKPNIHKIKARISHIQDQLQKHKAKISSVMKPEQIEFFDNYKNSKSKSQQSDASSDINSQLLNRQSNSKGKHSTNKSNSQARNSDNIVNRQVIPKRSSNFSELTSKYNDKKTARNESPPIEEEQSDLYDSLLASQKEHQNIIDYSAKSKEKNVTKRDAMNSKARQNKQMPRTKPLKKREQSQEEEEENYSQEKTQQRSPMKQRDSRIKEHQLHDPVAFLRKKKQWREAAPRQSSQKQKHISQHVEVDPAVAPKQQNQINKFRYSQNKQTPSKPVKPKTIKHQEKVAQTPKKKTFQKEKSSQKAPSPVLISSPGVKSTFGRIKKNKKKQNFSFKHESKHSSHQDKVIIQPQSSDNQAQRDEQYEQALSPATPDSYCEENSSANEKISPSQTEQGQSVAHSGKIIRNNSRMLAYYKSQDICYEGQSKAQTSNKVSRSGSEQEKISSSKNNHGHKKKAIYREDSYNYGSSSNEKVQGWDMNSEQEYDYLQSEQNLENEEIEGESDPDNEQMETNQPTNRRNSIDNQLANIGDDDNIEADEKLLSDHEPKEQRQNSNKSMPNQNENRAEINEIHPQEPSTELRKKAISQRETVKIQKKQSLKDEVAIANPSGSNADSSIQNNASEKQIVLKQVETTEHQSFKQQQVPQVNTIVSQSEKTAFNPSQDPAEVTKVEEKKVKTEKKSEQKKQKKHQTKQTSQQQTNKNEKKEVIKSKPQKKYMQQDLQRDIVNQYASFLSAKISGQLCKEQPVTIPVENNAYEDVQFVVNVNLCASIDSIAPIQEECANNFLEYQHPEAVPETCEQVSNEDDAQSCKMSISNQKNQEDIGSEESSQCKQDSEHSQEENSKVINKEQEVKNQEKAIKSNQQPSKEIKEQNMVKKAQSSHKQSQQAVVVSTPTPQIANINKQQPISSENKSLIQATSKNVASSLKQSDIVSSSKGYQENNVYCQAKAASRLKEIGVQKELTLQVSVQTDQDEQILPVLLPRTNTITNRPLTSDRQSIKQIAECQSGRSEFNSTIRNNFLSQNRRGNFEKKQKKEIERAHIIDKIYSANIESQSSKFQHVINGNEEGLIKEEGLVLKLEEVYPNGSLFSEKGLQLQLISTKFTNILKIVEILAEKSQWLISRLFQDKHGLIKNRGFGVWICQQHEWHCILLDEHIKVNEKNQPLYSVHNGHQMWFNVLEKALAIALGGYEKLLKVDSSTLFTMLTGCNATSAKIKEDPSKNAKLLSLISDCLRKNYIIHGQKNFDKTKAEQGRQSIFYISSVRKSEEQTLIELSQDGKQNFWIKLSKFVQEFNKIDILHLRINHNFTHIDLGVGRPGQLTVVQLDFREEGQGCVTLTYLSESGELRAFLYKQEKNKVLKLVGQAKEKAKSHLFFECNFSEGRYFVFAQAEEKPARLSFLGEGHPSIRITQQIHSQGLKNQMAEYLPVKQNDQNRFKRSQMQYLQEWRERRGPRFRDNFVQSRLRETFVDYVLGKSRRS